MKARHIGILLATTIACLSLGGCDFLKSLFGGGGAPAPVKVTITGGNLECPLGNVRLVTPAVSVTTTSGQTLVNVSVDVFCVAGGARTPIPGVTLSVSGATLQPANTLGPTDANGKASRTFASGEQATSLVGRTVELQVVDGTGTAYPTSPATTVTITSQ